MLQRVLTEDIRLKIHLNKMLGYVKADSGQMSRLVVDLVSFVEDSMLHGGTLTIETENFIFDKNLKNSPVGKLRLNPGHILN